jgi:hypothetical protein
LLLIIIFRQKALLLPNAIRSRLLTPVEVPLIKNVKASNTMRQVAVITGRVFAVLAQFITRLFNQIQAQH